jgi:hypothetical protein
VGFERRIDAAIYQTAFTAKVGSQSSEHGVVATGRHDHLSNCCIKRLIGILRNPYAMEQNGSLRATATTASNATTSRSGFRDAEYAADDALTARETEVLEQVAAETRTKLSPTTSK